MQQQQFEDFDLLAVFPEESKAEAAESKLRKEGYGEAEVFRLEAGAVGRGEFREHGPDRARGEVFLQTKRAGPSPRLVIFFAVLFGIVLGGLTFGVVDIGFKSLPLLPATLLGVLVGVIVGLILGLTRRGQVRGAIGQDMSRLKPATTPGKKSPDSESGGARTVVALRLPDAEDISRKSKARAILLTHGGKIDRSVGR